MGAKKEALPDPDQELKNEMRRMQEMLLIPVGDLFSRSPEAWLGDWAELCGVPPPHRVPHSRLQERIRLCPRPGRHNRCLAPLLKLVVSHSMMWCQHLLDLMSMTHLHQKSTELLALVR